MTGAQRVLAAAEVGIRAGGYNGFSFRDIAKDTGMTSAGVHHHFPTKADLVVRLVDAYTVRFIEVMDETPPEARVTRLRSLFGESIRKDGRMCLCGVLASEAHDLPEAVTLRARAFFEELCSRLEPNFPDSEDPRASALGVLARLEGAAMLSVVLSEPAVFDRATADLGTAV
jgi:TetR/AcrR family transcriptional repressor of nem operon